MSTTAPKVDGVPPSGANPRVSRPSRDETLAALQLAATATLALIIAVAPPGRPAPAAAKPAPPPIAAVVPAAPVAAINSSLEPHAILQSLLRQAGLRPTLDPHRLSWDQARRINALMPSVTAIVEAPQPFRIDLASTNGKQALRCLTQAAYYEAGANGADAEAAVAQVVLNRVRHPDFPKSVCGVVYQGAEHETGCQFTFTCDGALIRPLDLAAWNGARKVAERALGGYVVRPVGAATYYHADYVFPAWAPSLRKMTTVGPHIFYRMEGPQGSASVLTARYAGGELKLARAMLRAVDRFTKKPEREDKATLAEARDSVVPAGLRAQSDRLQRVHAVLAAQTEAPQAAKVETAQAAATAPESAVPAA
jgi:spore germination cell wall hydrolase CwlJ-like protein